MMAQQTPGSLAAFFVFVWLLAMTVIGGVDAWFLSKVLGFEWRAVLGQWVFLGTLGAWNCYDRWHWQARDRPMPAFPWRVLDRKGYRESRRDRRERS